MKKSLIYLLLIGFAAMLSTGEMFAQQMKVERWVVGSGGMVNTKNSDNWSVSGILGQVAIEKRIGSLDGKRLDVYQGFWVPSGEINPVIDNPIADGKMLSNYPNPVSVNTTIQYQVPNYSYVTLKVYDVVGNVVKVLYDGYTESGIRDVEWDTRDNQGLEVTSGSYLYELSVRPAQMAGGTDFQSFTLRNVMVIVR